MRRLRPLSITLAVAGALAWIPGTSAAATHPVHFNLLEASGTLSHEIAVGDTLFLDTLVPDTTGALSQSLTFTFASGVTGFTGAAAWEVAPLPGPRLVGVNIDIFDSSNNLVASDSFDGVLGSFAISSLFGNVGAGTYTLVATGNSLSTASLDVSITAVPEPETYAQLAVGLGLVGWMLRRRKR